MAINWIWALKAVPWADVVQAAPQIVKGARKLFTSTRVDVPVRGAGPAPEARAGSDSTQARLGQIEAVLETLHAEQQASAELIRALAEQNARVVEAMAILRARGRILLGICVVLAIGLIVLAVWVVSR